MQEPAKTQNKHKSSETIASERKNHQEFIDELPADTNIYIKESLIKSGSEKQQVVINTDNVIQLTPATFPLTHIPRIGVICYVSKGIG